MSFPGTISAGNITKCRGNFAGAQYLSLCPNTVVYKTTISGAPAVIPPGNSYVTFTVGATISGNAANVRADQRVLIGTVDDIRQAVFDWRVRKAIAGSTFAISETSTALASGMYVWVLDDYVLADKLSFLSLGFQYKDYDVAYRGLPPVICGLQSWYVGWVTGSPARLTVAFSASAVAAESGATISSYLYVTPDGTVTAGALNTATVTIAFPEGYRTVHLTVTDSGGRTMTRHIKVYAHSTNYLPALDFGGAQINHTVDGGQSISVESWDGTETLLDKTSCCGWTVERYGSTEGPIVNNVVFVGRLRQVRLDTKADAVYSAVQGAQWTIESPAEQLSHLECQSRALIPKAAPTLWDEIKSMTVWRAVVFLLAEHSTFLNLHDLTFDDTGTTFLIPQVGIQKGDLLRAVQDLIESINGHWEWAPAGESRIYRDNRYLTTAARNARTTVYNFTSADWIDLQFQIDPALSAGIVNGSGATYNSTSGQESPYLAMSPGTAPTEAPEEVPFARQYLTANLSAAAAKAELGIRSANRLAIEQKKIKAVLTLPDNYRWLTPTGSDWYTITCAATDNQLGLVYTTGTRWLCESVSTTWDNQTGTCSVQAVFTIETGPGVDYVAFEPPAASEEPFALPDIPTFDPYADLFPMLPDLLYADGALPEDALPDSGTTLKKDGSVQIFADPTNKRVYVTRNGLAVTPTYLDVTPTLAVNEAPQACVFDPFSVAPAIGAYFVSTDGTNSWVWSCPNVFAGTVEWTKGGSLSGQWTEIATTATADAVVIAGLDRAGGGDLTVYDFTASDCGFTAPSWGHYDTGIGWASDWDTDHWTMNIGKAISAPYSTVSRVRIYYQYSGGTPANPGTNGTVGAFNWYGFTTGTYPIGVWDITGTSGNYTSFGLEVGTGYSDTPWVITRIEVYENTASSDALLATSLDRGATWDTPKSIGSGLDEHIGLDTQRSGTNVFAGANGKVYRATTIGGALAEWYTITGGAMPACLILPYFNWSGASQTDAANPDIILGLTAVDGSSRTLLWIEGGATPGTVHDLTPVASFVFSNSHAITALYQHHLACTGSVSGTPKLARSTDQGSAWTVTTRSGTPSFIRCRRGDNSGSASGTNKGQIAMLEAGSLYYSSTWDATAPGSRTPPGACTRMDWWG